MRQEDSELDPSAGQPATSPADRDRFPTRPKYPECKVQLSGEDGNAFAVVGRVQHALRRYLADRGDADFAEAEVSAFFEEATSGDYDHLLQTCMRWVEVA